MAYVIAGKANKSILDTYSIERQPVGVQIITRANQGLRDHNGWLETIGMLEPDVTKRQEILKEFEDLSETGRKRRADFRQGIATTATEFHGLGAEMNQRYESTGVFLADEDQPYSGGVSEEESVFHYKVSTYPGKRLPHAWLNSRIPGEQISTIDLAGHGAFCLFTGPQGGRTWKDAAATVGIALGVEIRAYTIGWKQDYEDVYSDWARLSEVEEDGCVLVRPDRFVAWRSRAAAAAAADKLGTVMAAILGR